MHEPEKSPAAVAAGGTAAAKDATATKLLAEFTAFRRALTDESDRGCALFAAAYLDKALGDLIRASVVQHKDVESDLLRGTAPLSAFSARIAMAFYLGKISKSARAELDRIRKIRNEFAHHAQAISFEEPSIADRCRSLAYSYHEKQSPPREHFTASCAALQAMLQGRTGTSVPPSQVPDDAPTDERKAKHRQMVAVVVEKVVGAAGPIADGSSGKASPAP